MEETMKKPSESERMVLSVLYSENREMTSNEIKKKIQTEYGKKWTQQTTCTMLKRLKEKGYISSYRRGRRRYYTVTVGKEEYAAGLLQEYELFCRIAGIKTSC